MKKIIIAVSCLIFLGAASIAHAQSEQEEVFDEDSLVEEIGPDQTVTDKNEASNKKTELPYQPITIQNLSRAYWKIGKMDTNSDKHISEFLRINECDLYKRYFYDDFAWKDILKATKTSILDSMPKYNTRFETIIPVELDRYNTETEYFQIMPKDAIDTVKKFRASAPQFDRLECAKVTYESILDYPSIIDVSLVQAFSLKGFPLKRYAAEMYLDDIRSSIQHLSLKEQESKYKRMAYVRLKFDITSYFSTYSSDNGIWVAGVQGRIEGYEVYADQSLQKPLYMYNLKDRRRPRRIINRLPTEMELPAPGAAGAQTQEEIKPAEEAQPVTQEPSQIPAPAQ